MNNTKHDKLEMAMMEGWNQLPEQYKKSRYEERR
jgi:hypothetical protein